MMHRLRTCIHFGVWVIWWLHAWINASSSINVKEIKKKEFEEHIYRMNEHHCSRYADKWIDCFFVFCLFYCFYLIIIDRIDLFAIHSIENTTHHTIKESKNLFKNPSSSSLDHRRGSLRFKSAPNHWICIKICIYFNLSLFHQTATNNKYSIHSNTTSTTANSRHSLIITTAHRRHCHHHHHHREWVRIKIRILK